MLTDDRPLYDILACSVTVLALGWLVVALTRVVRRRRPGLELGRALAAAAALRLALAAVVAAVPALRPLRGLDETTFVHQAQQFAADPSSLGAMPQALVGNLHVAYMGVQQLVLQPVSDYPLRVGHIALAVTAIAVVAVAVNEIAGVRAATITAWILAFEPTGVFFSGVLHKEAPMLLGEALVILGAVRFYQRRDATAVALMVPGLAIAGFTRPYAGAALAVACAAVCLHAALRRLGSDRRRAPRIVVGLVLAVAVATAAAPAPATVLRTVQLSQNANATDTSNLRLDPIDFSSVGSTARNLGARVTAVLLRPYPWQVGSSSQRAGIVGTATAWALLLVALALVATRARSTLTALAPLLYVFVTLTAVYALSTGNAGTGFRYRTHLLVALAAIVAAVASLPRKRVRAKVT
ncbi:MAG: hypothetical protein KY463_15970 [Actinobacteria bacterium]|nr:hypothetical protein [Actinomycetota bacterium]